MTDRRRELLASLLALTVLFFALLLALVYLGSWWVRAGGLAGALTGILLSGRRDPPPYGRLLYKGPARPLMSEADRRFVSGLREQRGKLPRIAALAALVILLVAVGGSLAGHPRYAPFTGSGSAAGATPPDALEPLDQPGRSGESAGAGGPPVTERHPGGASVRIYQTVLYQSGLALLAMWLGILAGASFGWLGLVLAERAKRSGSARG